jgi:methyl-accepting chemotaxis protein
VGLVGETRQALSRILSQIGVIGQVIGEIAASAQEQATSLIEVNSAVAKMDLVTQENAAMVEQTTAATHSLAHETEGLSRSTQRFRIADATLQGARAGRRTG